MTKNRGHQGRETERRSAGPSASGPKPFRARIEFPAPSDAEIRIGISACLLGEEVRFDGGHKRDRFLTDTVASFVSFVPVCPEIEIGLSAPRETMHLERVGDSIRLLTTKTHEDLTDRMARWSEKRVRQLETMDLCGFILKKDSPSCGMERVRVYGQGGSTPHKSGRGIFAAELVDRSKTLPIEEEGRLHDPRLRDNFFVRVFAFRRLKSLFRKGWTVGDLVAFHTAEKLLLRAHDPKGYQELGRLVAAAKGRPRGELEQEYSEGMMLALRKHATPRKVASVLQHTIGHLRRQLDEASRGELRSLVEDYRSGLVPLVVPLTLVGHHARHHEIDYLLGQSFLTPHPKELMLRNHV